VKRRITKKAPSKLEVQHAYFRDPIKLPGRNIDQYTKGEERQTFEMFYVPSWDKMLVKGTYRVGSEEKEFERFFDPAATLFFDLC
jgi:hypothetical protein